VEPQGGRSKRLHVTAERAPFVMLPRWLLYHEAVGEGAKFLYCVLHDLVNGREGPTRPVTRAKLAELSRVSANTIDRRLAELIAAGAVEKEPQILAGGQVANVYHVWLTPPEQRQPRIPTNGMPRSGRIPTVGDPASAAVDNRVPMDGEAQQYGITTAEEPPRQWGAPLLADGDPTVFEEVEDEEPPTPRTAGESTFIFENPGRKSSETGGPARLGGRRTDATNLRALGANPRARETAERTARLEAALEARTAARLAEERAGEAGRAAFEAEALAVSAALDDERLATIVDSVRDQLIGPLAQSALPVTRAVVDWCRQAAADRPDSSSLGAAVTAALAAGQRLPSVPPAPLSLAAAPPGTVPLRRRVATLMGSRVEEAV
jgi:hypothetical protein